MITEHLALDQETKEKVRTCAGKANRSMADFMRCLFRGKNSKMLVILARRS